MEARVVYCIISFIYFGEKRHNTLVVGWNGNEIMVSSIVQKNIMIFCYNATIHEL